MGLKERVQHIEASVIAALRDEKFTYDAEPREAIESNAQAQGAQFRI